MRIESFLIQSPVFQASRLARKIESSVNRILAEEKLTFFEALILAAIFFEKKGRIQPSHLAATLQTTRANLSHSISSLEAKGLVQRKIDPEDARAIHLLLSSQGERRAASVVGILDRIQHHLEQTISVSKLTATLAQMRAIEELCSQLANSATRPE